jgi:Tfp pilus assembly protein FimT
MKISKNSERGYTLIELLTILGVVSILIVIAGSFSSQFFQRRDIDQLTNAVSGDLQLTKLKAARAGVEYRFSMALSAEEDMLEITRERGNSNNLSSNWTEISSQEFRVENYIDITLVPSNPIVIKPNGSVTLNPSTLTESSYVIRPKDGSGYNRCGQVGITRLGHVTIIKGNWDGSSCNQIKDN